MKLGLDAKWLHHGPPSGKRVVRGLVGALAKIAAERGDELHLFLDARDPRDDALAAVVPPSRRHHVWADVNALANVAVIPRLADRLALDAVVYQNFVPPAARHERVAFVHDAIHVAHPEWFTRRDRFYLAPLRRLAATADRVCTVSHTERTRLAALGFARAERIDVVPNAVDAGFRPPAARDAERVARTLASHGLPARFALYVGRLNARKNVATLVRAVAHLRGDLSLVVAGAADRTSPDLHAIARTAGIASRVHLLGAVDDDTLGALYAAARAFCFPSLDEGFGLSPLEAMACGVPTVVSDIPVLAETCGGGALRVDPHDPRAIAAAIDALCCDGELRARVRAAGIRHVSDFTWDRSAATLLHFVHPQMTQMTQIEAAPFSVSSVDETVST